MVLLSQNEQLFLLTALLEDKDSGALGVSKWLNIYSHEW